jgi:hypothetical protein
MLDAKRERRRKRYKFALVKWAEMDGWEDQPKISIEHKDVLRTWWQLSHEVLCDDQPYKVLKAMATLAEENEK